MTLNILSRFIENMVIILKSDPQPPKYLPPSTFFSNPAYQSSDASIAHESRYQVNLSRSKLSRAIYRPDHQTSQKLAAKGILPVTYEKTMKDLESISNNPSLTSKQKKDQVENLRKQLGLSKKEMKTFFTKPLAKAYKEAADGLKGFLKTKESQLNQELNLAEKLHGENSPQAQAVQRRINLLRTSLQPEIERFSEKSKFYSSMYPSFWSKLGGIFKKVGQGVLKVISFSRSLLGKIPSLLKTFKPFISLIPGVGSFASIAISGMEAIMKVLKK